MASGRHQEYDMSKDIGTSGATASGQVTAKVEKSEQELKAAAQAAAHRARQVASLEEEIRSEQESLKLLGSRALALKDRIDGLQKQLDQLKAAAPTA